MTAEVAASIEEIRAAYSEAVVTVCEDEDGGAIVSVESVDLGPTYDPRETWIKFHVTFQYPFSDVYPHFVRPDLKRTDGAPLGQGVTVGTFEGEKAVQVSRRSNHLNPAIDTAALKLAKVLDWLRTR